MKNIKIIHSCNNRIRIQIPAYQRNADALDHLNNKIRDLTGITHIRVNQTISCMIFHFDMNQISQKTIVQELENHLLQWLSKNMSGGGFTLKSSKKENPLLKPLLNFLSISFVGISVLIRPLFTNKGLIQTPASMLGLISMLSALPLMKKCVKDIQNRRISSGTILDVSVYASIFAGEILAAIEILWITHAGDLLQAWITERSRRAISSIARVSEKNVIVLKDGHETEITADQLKPQDIVKFYTGDKLAVDGDIIDGFAEIDESSITGRSEPVEKSKGNQIFAGAFVYQGEITVRAQKVGGQTYLAKIFQMVEDSLENKADIEGIAEQLSQKLIILDLAVTVTTLVVTRNIWRSFSVMLVMACPCATVLAASTAITSALYLAAKNAVLIKGGRYLEELRNVDFVCFDKTGTLTSNEPELTFFKNFSNMDDARLIQLIYSAERQSDHPLAIGFKNAAKRQGIDFIDRESSQFIPGKGVHSVIQGNQILVGNKKLLDHFKISTDNFQKDINEIYQKSVSPVFIAMNNELCGIAAFETPDRKGIAKVIDYLRQDGIKKISVLTGDARQTAADLCSRYHFDSFHHSILPEDKAKIIADIQKKGHCVMMIGDGMNDSLALAKADIGLAMGAGGSEIAVEAADIALVNDNLQSLIFARSLSHETIRIIYQNFWIAFGSDIFGVALGALGYLSPLMAGSLHIFHTLGIVGNSSRILLFSPQ